MRSTRTARVTLFLLLALLAAAPVARAAAQQPAAQPPSAQARDAQSPVVPRTPQSPPLVLRPGDVLRIMVRDEPSLSGEFPITASGEVLLPEAGLVAVAGLPFPELESAVRAAYATQLVNPQVVVVPLARVAVLGEVRGPGVFSVEPTHTVADLLAAAGGLTPAGSLSGITLLRDGTGQKLRLDPGEPALGGRIRSGDQIIAARRSWMSDNMPVIVGATASVLAAAATALLIR